MKKLFIFITCLLLVSPVSISAQRKAVKKQGKNVVADDPKFLSMLNSTAQLTVIDSIVVDSASYLDVILANPEEGRVTTYDRFFEGDGKEIVYINEIGNKCIYSGYDEDLETKVLYQRTLLGDGWTYGEELQGLNEDGRLYDFDYPYLMPDGVTLYFSAKSVDGLGGYDIYRTRFDADKGTFLRPENLGLPFNSSADDYMFVIDEENQLGYFATNRRQPQGKTCVYTFIPLDTRKTVSTDNPNLRSLANLDKISDTWNDANLIKTSLRRKEQVEKLAIAKRTSVRSESFQFVINDSTVYTKMNDFKMPASRQLMRDIIDHKKQLSLLEVSLQKARNYYATASADEKKKLAPEILESEKQEELLRNAIIRKEKTIRNTENLKQ
jgi:hypothetical protein